VADEVCAETRQAELLDLYRVLESVRRVAGTAPLRARGSAVGADGGGTASDEAPRRTHGATPEDRCSSLLEPSVPTHRSTSTSTSARSTMTNAVNTYGASAGSMHIMPQGTTPSTSMTPPTATQFGPGTAPFEVRRAALVNALAGQLAALGTAADHQIQPPWAGNNPAAVEGRWNVQPVEATIVAEWTASRSTPHSNRTTTMAL
jgi:hypothetical protein